jgi:hypothetical protein
MLVQKRSKNFPLEINRLTKMGKKCNFSIWKYDIRSCFFPLNSQVKKLRNMIQYLDLYVVYVTFFNLVLFFTRNLRDE